MNKKHKILLTSIISIAIVITGLFAYWYMFIRFRIPENADIKYELDGVLYTESEVIPETQEYTIIVTDLDTNRVYKKKNYIVYDTKAPTITVDNGERFYIKEFTNLYSGLTITDNFDSEPLIEIEGVDVDEHAFYDVLVRVSDKFGNFREEVLECQVLSERYIDAEEKVWKERTFEGYKEFSMKRVEPETIDYTMFVDTTFEEVLSKIDSKETFALFLGFDNCPWCRDVKPILQEEAKNLNINIYYIDIKDGKCEALTCNLDIDENVDENYTKWLESIGQEVLSVPYFITYKDGEILSSYQTPNYDAHLKNISDKNSKKVHDKYKEMLGIMLTEEE